MVTKFKTKSAVTRLIYKTSCV